jgi:hypothetical protein
MCGCVSPAAISISLRKRCVLMLDTSSDRMTLSATSRECLTSRATKTVAVAPRPISRSMM